MQYTTDKFASSVTDDCYRHFSLQEIMRLNSFVVSGVRGGGIKQHEGQNGVSGSVNGARQRVLNREILGNRQRMNTV